MLSWSLIRCFVSIWFFGNPSKSQFDTIVTYGVMELSQGLDAVCKANDTRCQINCDGYCWDINIICPQTQENCELCEINCNGCKNVNINSTNCSNVEIHSLATEGLIDSRIYIPLHDGNVTIDAIDLSEAGDTWIDNIEIIDSNSISNNDANIFIEISGARMDNSDINATNSRQLNVICNDSCAFNYNIFRCPDNNYKDGVSCTMYYGSNTAAYQNQFYAKEGLPTDISLTWVDAANTYTGGGEASCGDCVDYVHCTENWSLYCTLQSTDTSCFLCTIPTIAPTDSPSDMPTTTVTIEPTSLPIISSTQIPSQMPIADFSNQPTKNPTYGSSVIPSTDSSSDKPSVVPTIIPTSVPIITLSENPSEMPTDNPVIMSSNNPSIQPSEPFKYTTDLPTSLVILSTAQTSLHSSVEPSLKPSAVSINSTQVIATDDIAKSTDAPVKEVPDSSNTSNGLSVEELVLFAAIGAGGLVFCLIFCVCFWFLRLQYNKKNNYKNVQFAQGLKKRNDGKSSLQLNFGVASVSSVDNFAGSEENETSKNSTSKNNIYSNDNNVGPGDENPGSLQSLETQESNIKDIVDSMVNDNDNDVIVDTNVGGSGENNNIIENDSNNINVINTGVQENICSKPKQSGEEVITPEGDGNELDKILGEAVEGNGDNITQYVDGMNTITGGKDNNNDNNDFDDMAES